MQGGAPLGPGSFDGDRQRFRRRFRDATTSVATRDERTQVFSKTKMCKFYILGVCTKGKGCNFAHQREDLQVLPNLNCTKLCKTLISKGTCTNPDCRYAHNKEEMRMVPGFNISGAVAMAHGMEPPAKEEELRRSQGGAASSSQRRADNGPRRQQGQGQSERTQPHTLTLSAMTESSAPGAVAAAAAAAQPQLSWSALHMAFPGTTTGVPPAAAAATAAATAAAAGTAPAAGSPPVMMTPAALANLDVVSQAALLQIGQAAQAHAAEALRLQAMAAALQTQALKGGTGASTTAGFPQAAGDGQPATTAAAHAAAAQATAAGLQPAAGASAAPTGATGQVEGKVQKKRRGSRGGGGASRALAAAQAGMRGAGAAVPPSIAEHPPDAAGDDGGPGAGIHAQQQQQQSEKMALMWQQQQLQQQQLQLQQQHQQLQQQHQQLSEQQQAQAAAASSQNRGGGSDLGGSGVVIKNTFISVEDRDNDRPLRPVKTCSGHLSGWMASNADADEQEDPPSPAGGNVPSGGAQGGSSRRLQEPEKINPLTLRSVSSQSLRSLDPCAEEDEEDDRVAPGGGGGAAGAAAGSRLDFVPEHRGIYLRQEGATGSSMSSPPGAVGAASRGGDSSAGAGANVGGEGRGGGATASEFSGSGVVSPQSPRSAAGERRDQFPQDYDRGGAYDNTSLRVKNTFLDFRDNNQPVGGLRVVHTAAGRLDTMGGTHQNDDYDE